MNLPAPKGWTVYGGADGFDAIPDANGYLWWGDDMWQTGKSKNETWQYIVCRYKNGVSEIVPIAEKLNGAGRLNWTPAGLYVSVSHNEPDGSVTSKVYYIPQYAQFTGAPSTVVLQVPGTISTFDQQARTDITKLTGIIATIQQQLVRADTVKSLIEARLLTFLHALDTNDRRDTINTLWMDILFKKTNDWIYGFLKDRGLVK